MKLNTIKEHYKNGMPHREYTVNEKGQVHGTYKDWYPNGQLWVQREYVNNKLHGIEHIWDDDGMMRYKSQYNHGDTLITVRFQTNFVEIVMHGIKLEPTGWLAKLIIQLINEGTKLELTHH